jgi:hypothetical protein
VLEACRRRKRGGERHGIASGGAYPRHACEQGLPLAVLRRTWLGFGFGLGFGLGLGLGLGLRLGLGLGLDGLVLCRTVARGVWQQRKQKRAKHAVHAPHVGL